MIETTGSGNGLSSSEQSGEPDPRIVLLKSEQATQEEKVEAFTSIVNDWYPSLLAKTTTITKSPDAAEDVTQETFLAAWEKIDSCDGVNVGGWLWRIMINKSYDFLRKQKKSNQRKLNLVTPDNELLNDIVLDQQTDPTDIETDYATRETLGELINAKNITTEQKKALLLLGAGLKYREISELLEIPFGTAVSRIHRGRSMARVLLGEV